MWALLAIFAVVAYIVHYLTTAIKDTHLYCGSHRFADFLSTRCSLIHQRYWPNPFIANTHLMTRFCVISRSRLAKLQFCREILPTSDHGQFSLDWYAPGRTDFTSASLLEDHRPVVIFLPGIAGNSSAEYLRTLVPLAAGLGYRPVVLNYRGLTSTPLLNSRLYCALYFDDLETALKHFKSIDPNITIIGVGLSMGGTALGSYLTSRGSASLLDGAFLASVVWDAVEGAVNLERGFWNRDLNKTMTKMLVKVVQRHRHWFEDDEQIDLDQVERCKTLRSFDEAFTRRAFGYESVDAYYRASTLSNKISQIKVPTLVLQAADDVIAPLKDLPLEQVKSSSHVAMLVTARGGHLGFMDAAKSDGQTTYYLERLFVQYLKALYDWPTNLRQLIVDEKET